MEILNKYFKVYTPPIDSWKNENEGIHKVGLHTISNNTFYSHKQNHYALKTNYARLYLRISNDTNECQILLIDNENTDFALSIIRLKENIYPSLNDFLNSKGLEIIENFFAIKKATEKDMQKITNINFLLKDIDKYMN